MAVQGVQAPFGLAGCHGREQKLAGDGVSLRIESPALRPGLASEAKRCARDTRKTLHQMNASEPSFLAEDDIAAMIRLLAELAADPSDLPAKKRRLMGGLAEEIQADGWLWTATRVRLAEDQPISMGVLYDGLTEHQFTGWVEASQVAKPPPPEDGPLTDLFVRGEHFTRTRQQLVDDYTWYSHPSVQQYRLQRGIDHFLYSIYPVSDELCSAIGFFRATGREAFSERDRRICHLLSANVTWMHLASFPDHGGSSVPDLTPRQRIVLVHLLDGKTKREIAVVLHLSEPTVGEHIGKIYRHFGVGSQVELMRFFQAGYSVD